MQIVGFPMWQQADLPHCFCRGKNLVFSFGGSFIPAVIKEPQHDKLTMWLPPVLIQIFASFQGENRGPLTFIQGFISNAKVAMLCASLTITYIAMQVLLQPDSDQGIYL